MIFLSPLKTRTGDFWNSWPTGKTTFGVPDIVAPDDVVVHDVRLGQPEHPSQTIGLLLSNNHISGGADPNALARIAIGLRTCARIVATSSDIYWPDSTVLPLGVDTDLFRPRSNIAELRTLYGLPTQYPVGCWCGSMEYVDGYDRLRRYVQLNVGIHWVLIFDRLCYPTHLPCHNTLYYDVSQAVKSDIMGCADFVLNTTRTKVRTTVDLEAMACELRSISVDGGRKNIPLSTNQRQYILDAGLDRVRSMEKWLQYVQEFRQWLQKKA